MSNGLFPAETAMATVAAQLHFTPTASSHVGSAAAPNRPCEAPLSRAANFPCRALFLRCSNFTSRSSHLGFPLHDERLHFRSLLRSSKSADFVARAALESMMQAGKGDGVILLVGVTGGTGSSVVNGLLAAGVDSSKLRVLTRSPEGAAARNLAAIGVQAITGDLDDADSLRGALSGVKAIYCHATSKDGARADPAGELRAERLAKAASSAGVEHIVYNSSGGGGHGISQVEQKHHIENIFRNSSIPTTNLRATMFMEEFWKSYTRPQILKGRFPFSMPSDKPLQLLAVKDLGLAAGIALNEPEVYGSVSLELAGDELTAAQMCDAYSKAQGSSVSHFSPPKFLFWFLNRDLYRISKFLSEEGYKADIGDCRRRFPGLLTFSEFLDLSHWGDASKVYSDSFKY